MLTNGNCMSVPVVTSLGDNGNDGFGGDGWWIILLFIFIAAFGGWGNGNGFGGNGGGQTSSVYEGYVLNNDFSQLSSQISDAANMLERRTDNITNGLCDGFYTTAQQINGVNTNIMQGTNALQGAIKDCCCQTQQNIADVKYTIGSTNADINYNLATQANMLDRGIADGFCKTNFNNATNTRDIVDSQNANTRAILDKLCQMENNAKDEKIAELTAKNFDLRLAASQEKQNSYLIDQLGYHCPVSAYVVQPPQTVSFPTGCNGAANYVTQGCGCGCN